MSRMLHTSALSLFRAFPILSETTSTELQHKVEKFNLNSHTKKCTSWWYTWHW